MSRLSIYIEAVAASTPDPSPELAAFVEQHRAYIAAGETDITPFDAWSEWANKNHAAWAAMSKAEQDRCNAVYYELERAGRV